MPINLEEHVVVHSGIKFIPLAIAQKAINEAYGEVDNLEQILQSALTKINKTIEEND